LQLAAAQRVLVEARLAIEALQRALALQQAHSRGGEAGTAASASLA
jgi:hypothetical protein